MLHPNHALAAWLRAAFGQQQFLFITAHIIRYASLDPVNRVQQVADRQIVVEGVDDQRDIFAHIAGDIIRL